MNISTPQLHAIRALLNKKDKESIAEQADKKPRTVEAVLQGDRPNDDIERLAVKQARMKLAKLQRVLDNIEAKNHHTIILIEEYQELKKNSPTLGEDYNRYMDVYLDLVHVKFEDKEALWEHLSLIHPDIIVRPFWCVNLFVRLLGISEEHAIAFHNSKK
jgi:hypothetical protein